MSIIPSIHTCCDAPTTRPQLYCVGMNKADEIVIIVTNNFTLLDVMVLFVYLHEHVALFWILTHLRISASVSRSIHVHVLLKEREPGRSLFSVIASADVQSCGTSGWGTRRYLAWIWRKMSQSKCSGAYCVYSTSMSTYVFDVSLLFPLHEQFATIASGKVVFKELLLP